MLVGVIFRPYIRRLLVTEFGYFPVVRYRWNIAHLRTLIFRLRAQKSVKGKN